jgi:hypothetical protein
MIEDIIHTAFAEARRIKDLIAVTFAKSVLAQPVSQAMGAMFVCLQPMTFAAQFVMREGGKDLRVTELHRLVNSFATDINMDDLDRNTKPPTDDEKAMSKTAINSEIGALQAAVDSVKMGNPKDAPRILQHAHYIQAVAAEHPAEIKANKKQLKTIANDVHELSTADPSLSGIRNILSPLTR